MPQSPDAPGTFEIVDPQTGRSYTIDASRPPNAHEAANFLREQRQAEGGMPPPAADQVTANARSAALAAQGTVEPTAEPSGPTLMQQGTDLAQGAAAATPDAVKQTLRGLATPQNIGGLLGAGGASMMLGPEAGPLGKIAGSAAGAYLGGAGGSLGDSAYKALRGDPMAPQSVEDALGRMTSDATEQGFSQAIGDALTFAAPPVMRFFGGAGKPAADALAADALLKQGTGRLPGLLPSEMGLRGLPRTMEGISTNAAISALPGYKAARQQAVTDLAEQAGKAVGPLLSVDNIGTALGLGKEAGFDAAMATARPLFDQVATEAEGKLVQVPEMMPMGGGMAGVDKFGKPLPPSNPIMVPTGKMVNKIVGGIPVDMAALKDFVATKAAQADEARLSGTAWQRARDQGDTIDFGTANMLREHMQAEARNMGPMAENQQRRGELSRVAFQIDDSMRKALVDAGRSDLLAKWETARTLTREAHDQFNQDFMDSALRSAFALETTDPITKVKSVTGYAIPQAIYNKWYGRGQEAIGAQAMTMLRRAIPEEAHRNAMRRFWTDLMTDTGGGTQLTNAIRDRKEWIDAASNGLPALEGMRDTMTKLAQASGRFNVSGAGLTGSAATNWQQGGLVLRTIVRGATVVPAYLLGSHAVGTDTSEGFVTPGRVAGTVAGATAVFLAPWVMSRLLLNPTYNALLRGVAVGRAPMAVVTRLAEAARKANDDLTPSEAQAQSNWMKVHGVPRDADIIGADPTALPQRAPAPLPPG